MRTGIFDLVTALWLKNFVEFPPTEKPGKTTQGCGRHIAVFHRFAFLMPSFWFGL
jgi:hypothetical protein